MLLLSPKGEFLRTLRGVPLVECFHYLVLLVGKFFPPEEACFFFFLLCGWWVVVGGGVGRTRILGRYYAQVWALWDQKQCPNNFKTTSKQLWKKSKFVQKIRQKKYAHDPPPTKTRAPRSVLGLTRDPKGEGSFGSTLSRKKSLWRPEIMPK